MGREFLGRCVFYRARMEGRRRSGEGVRPLATKQFVAKGIKMFPRTCSRVRLLNATI